MAAAPVALALALLLAPAREAAAARGTHATPRYGQAPETAPRQYSGGGLLYGTPYREFADHVGTAYGFGAVGSNAMDDRGVTRLRSDITLLYHRNHDAAVPESQLEAGDQLTLGSSSNLFHVLIGPEFAVATGGFRPYLFGLGGYGTSNVKQKLDGQVNAGADPYHLETSQRSSMITWGFGAGIRVRINPTLMLDLSGEYRDAMGSKMITTSEVTSAAGQVNYGQRKLQAEQLLFRLGFARAQ
jgi:opacity protein-like surface antigen